VRKLFFVLILCICAANVSAQLRSFSDVFPGISQRDRAAIFSDSGLVRSTRRSDGIVLYGNDSRVDMSIIEMVLRRNPAYLIESISILPADPGTVTLLHIYNALGNIRDLSGRLYDSATRNRAVPLFEEATRVTNERSTSAIPDPPPARALPASETIYIRLRDANFGNTYYRGEMAVIQNGLRYTLTNFRAMTYLFIPVIGTEKFITQLYFELIQEGVLIYSIAGMDISDFFASRISIDSAISKRLEVIIDWASDGIRRAQ